MSSKETYMGSVEDVNGSTVRISLSKQSLTGFVYIKGQGYRVGQIGSFVRIPIGFVNLYGIVSSYNQKWCMGRSKRLKLV